jgi:hypothetical protein
MNTIPFTDLIRQDYEWYEYTAYVYRDEVMA